MTAEQTRKAALARSMEAQAMAKRENAKHTPGPWLTHREGFSTVYVEARIGGGWVQEIAACGPTSEGSEQQDANARLIAAAPELLEALRIAREFMSIASDWNLHEAEINGEMRSTYDWLEVVDAAIAKATGDTP